MCYTYSITWNKVYLVSHETSYLPAPAPAQQANQISKQREGKSLMLGLIFLKEPESESPVCSEENIYSTTTQDSLSGG